MDIPVYYSYRTRPEYFAEKCPAFVAEDAVRLWGDAFVNHPPIPNWSNDWSKFTFIKDWILPLSLWSLHDSDFSEEEVTCIRVRNRLHSCGEIIPILYYMNDHSRVLLRMGNRVLYCRTLLYGADEDDSSHIEALGALTLTYSEFVAADTDTILAHIYDRVAQTNLEGRYSHVCRKRREIWTQVIAFVFKEGQGILGKVPDEKTFDEWTEDEWLVLKERFNKFYYTGPWNF